MSIKNLCYSVLWSLKNLPNKPTMPCQYEPGLQLHSAITTYVNTRYNTMA